MKPRPPSESEAEDQFREAVNEFLQEHRELRVQLRELQQNEYLSCEEFDAAASAKVPDRKEEIRSMLSYEISQCPECRAWAHVMFLLNQSGRGNAPLSLECRKHREALERLDKPTPTVQPPSSLQWRTIDTAPRDGTSILAYDENDPRDTDRFTCYWHEGLKEWELMRPGRHCVSSDIEPTHWMPLPEGPKKS